MIVPREHSPNEAAGEPRVLWTVKEVASILAVSIPGTYELVRSGRLPAVRIGKRIRVDARVLERWIAEGGYGLDE